MAVSRGAPKRAADTGSHGRLVPSAFLFDLDGTLADSFGGISRALNRALEAVGLPGRDLAWVLHHVGRGTASLVRDALGDDAGEEKVKEVVTVFFDRYREAFVAESPPLPGARETLAFVARRTGRKVAVVSNKLAEFSRTWLEQWGLSPFVSRVVGPDTCGVRKPDPATVLPVLEGFGVRPEQALMVGDMEVDVITGRGVGLPVVGVCGPTTPRSVLRQAGAVAVLRGIEELPGWLQENCSGWGGAAILPPGTKARESKP